MLFATIRRTGLPAAKTLRLTHLALRIALLGFAAGLAPAAALAQADAQVATPLCKRDMLVLDSTLRNAMRALEAVGQASDSAKCTAYRKHVDTLHQASKTFARCTTGRQRQDNIAQMDRSAADFEALIRARCVKP